MNTWKDGGSGHFHSWYLDLKPSTVTFYHPKTQTRIVEPSYVAAERKGPPSHGADPGGFVTLGRLLAVGKEALAYQNTPDVAVFSPFRRGQIAHYASAQCFLRSFLSQFTSKSRLFRPVLFLHTQEQTTEVEERALLEAGLQAGARRVFLYGESLPFLLDRLSQDKLFQNAIVIHIDPPD